jgi:hypothetical protein
MIKANVRIFSSSKVINACDCLFVPELCEAGVNCHYGKLPFQGYTMVRSTAIQSFAARIFAKVMFFMNRIHEVHFRELLYSKTGLILHSLLKHEPQHPKIVLPHCLFNQ